ncbi:hypothetical protein GC207_08360 [bacterium]|nr:hypothetical protein [bacterium]
MLETSVIASLRRKAALEGYKWDIQVGDVSTLASFPLVMKGSEWKRLAAWAEQLAKEAAEAEKEILLRPDLLRELGMPRSLQKVLADSSPLTPCAGRVIRFDFHFTMDGWRISEANSDVPGGFSEASHFTALVAEYFPDLRPAGNPGEVWGKALAATTLQGGVVALLSAAGYMEDHQVNSFVAAQLRKFGCETHLIRPQQIRWTDGKARLETAWCRRPVDLIIRFYQAEWLARSPRREDWGRLFRGGKTLVANPLLAVISESKRFPLLWDRLESRLPTWRMLLPESRDPRQISLQSADGWLLKAAFGNTGDSVCIRELMEPRKWLRTRFNVLMSPTNWVAQRRFESVPLSTPIGQRHVCVGVYTVNGRATGAYARLAEKPLIDFAAMDVALLIEDDD